MNMLRHLGGRWGEWLGRFFKIDVLFIKIYKNKRSSEIYSLYEIRNEDSEWIKSTAAFDKYHIIWSMLFVHIWI